MSLKQLDKLEDLIESMIDEIKHLRLENNALKRQSMEMQENNAEILQIQKQNIELLAESNKILSTKVHKLEQELKLSKGNTSE
ncbi:hypothetical protein GKC56_06940 [Neisseriaceae bacterium PsAf]|nr:hypothetical protein [Neisseriaceae bacterium PsAf]MCV2503957.1 hypothetical protein [Neisseriaceae bacterium]